MVPPVPWRYGMRQTIKREDYAHAFEQGYPATRRFLLSRGAAGDQAEEIAQAAWAKGWECRDQLRDSKLLVMWVNTIAKHMFWSRFRTPPSVTIEGSEGTYHMELHPIDVRRLLDSCGQEERELLERHYLDGYTAEEIGRAIGLTAAGIRVRLLRLRRVLRQRVLAPPRRLAAAA